MILIISKGTVRDKIVSRIGEAAAATTTTTDARIEH